MNRMRIPLAFLLAVALGGLAPRAAAEPATMSSEEYNFEISTPDNEDWEFKEVDEEKHPTVKARLVTWYADTDPLATATVELHVMPLSRSAARYGYEKQVEKWQAALEGFLANPRERTMEALQVGGVDGFKVDVKGDHLAGIHQITYYLARNGKLQYLLYVTRNYDAVGDEWLADEIQEIVGSFKFHTIEKPKADSSARGDDAPGAGAGGADQGTVDEEIDPELLARKEYDMGFWRYKCVKPEGLLEKELSDVEKQQGIKQKFQHDRNYSRLMIRIWADSEKNARYTIDKLLETRIEEFKKYDKVKQMLDPEIDKRYDLPMADEAIRLELVGRSTMRIKRIWILANCRNDRQYQIEIYLSGSNGEEVWGDVIGEFLENFEPYK